MSTTRSGLLARAVTTLAAGAALVAAPGLATSASAADAPTDPGGRATYAATFIAATLEEYGDHYVYPDQSGALAADGFLDGGNTVDAVLALDGAGVGKDAADRALAFLADNVGDYVGADGATYAGPTAKALLAAAAHGEDPRSFGGVDLVERLRATEGAVTPGRFSDLPVDCGQDQCDYSNTIGQSLALLALTRAGEDVDQAATDFLLGLQCDDGGFRADPGAQECSTDPDATAFAAQALVAVGSDDEAGRALDALAGLAGSDGGVTGEDGTANANTTGVAVQAFLAGGRSQEAEAGQAFLGTLQYGCDAPEPLRGGIARDAATTSDATPGDSDLRATPQATLALAGESLVSVSSEGAAAEVPASACEAPATTSASPSAADDATAAASTTADDTGSPWWWAALGVAVVALVGLGWFLLRRRNPST